MVKKIFTYILKISIGIKKNSSFSEYLYFNLPKIFFIIIYFPFILILFFIKLFSPLILIKFGIYKRANRLGHFTADINCLIKENLNKKNILNIVGLDSEPANKEVYKLFSKKIIFLPVWFISPFLVLKYLKFLKFDKHFIKFNYFTGFDYSKNKSTEHINFNEKKGYEFFKRKNIDLTKNKFVLIYSRDQNYLSTLTEKNNELSFDHSEFRNSDIENLKLTAQYLEKKGYYVFRFGKKMKSKISYSSKKIIDYSFDYQSDYLDLFLSKNCEFFIGNASGAESIARMYNRPVLITNLIPIGVACNKDSLYFPIFKKFFCNDKKNYISLNEIYEKNLFLEYEGKNYKKKNISLIENNEIEILEATKEFIKFLDNKYEENETNLEFKKKYMKIIKKYIENKQFEELKYAGISEDTKNDLVMSVKLSNYFIKKNLYFIKD